MSRGMEGRFTCTHLAAARHLRWEDIDLTRGTIRWRRESDKKRKEWVIPIPEALVDELRQFQRRLLAAGGLVFPSPQKPSGSHRRAVAWPATGSGRGRRRARQARRRFVPRLSPKLGNFPQAPPRGRRCSGRWMVRGDHADSGLPAARQRYPLGRDERVQEGDRTESPERVIHALRENADRSPVNKKTPQRKSLQGRMLQGGAMGDRTPDLLNAIQALYQLSYRPRLPRPDLKHLSGRNREGYPGVCRFVKNFSLLWVWTEGIGPVSCTAPTLVWAKSFRTIRSVASARSDII
jgi:hypothetical protein